jgi:hypothetical protein
LIVKNHATVSERHFLHIRPPLAGFTAAERY